MKTRIRDLKGDVTQVYGFTATVGAGSYVVTTVRRPSGTTIGKITVDGSAQKVTCDVDRTWSHQQNTIEISFGRDCISPGAVGINAYIGAGNGRAVDPDRATKTVT